MTIMIMKKEKGKRRLSKDYVFYGLLIFISALAPLVSYAGVSLIYPGSTLTGGINTSPPIT